MQNEVLKPVNTEIYKTAARRLGDVSNLEKTLGTFLVAAPITYYTSAKAEAKARQGIPISDREDFVRRNPFITAVGGTLAARSVVKGFGQSAANYTAKRKASSEAAKQTGTTLKKAPLFGRTKKASIIGEVSPENVNLIYQELIS